MQMLLSESKYNVIFGEQMNDQTRIFRMIRRRSEDKPDKLI